MQFYDIWNNNFSKVEEVYSGDNWKSVIHSDVDNNECIIFFSSNNVWFPNDENAFNRSFIDNDYYEWSGRKKTGRKKEIYVRDIYKQWYVTGINCNVNSIDKLYSLLLDETKGMSVVTVGSSAGGYMATLMGCLLNAEYVLCFSAQFNLQKLATQTENFYLVKYADDTMRNKYFETSRYIKESGCEIFYVMPAFSPSDIEQFNYVKELSNVKVLKIASDHHGVPIFNETLNILLTNKRQNLEKIFLKNSKTVNPVLFSARTAGVLNTVKDIYKILKKHLIRK